MNFRTGLFPDLEWHLWRAWHIDTFLHHVTGQVKISSKNFAWPWKTNAHVHQWLLHWFIKGSPDNYGCMDIHNTVKGSPRGMTKEPLDERHAGGGGVGARKSHLSALKVTQPSDNPIKIPHAPESKDSKSCPLSFSENTTSICILYMHMFICMYYLHTRSFNWRYSTVAKDDVQKPATRTFFWRYADPTYDILMLCAYHGPELCPSNQIT